MNNPFAVAGVVFAILISVMSAGAADKPVKLPAFPGQPNINTALKQLGMAREKADAKPDDAVVHLKLALVQLEGSKSNRGSFRATSIRLTKQAIKHLDEKDAATAKHEVDEAIENVTKAGEAGEKAGAKR